jgi:hypothetical protein
VAKEEIAILRDILATLRELLALERARAADEGLEAVAKCPACGSADILDAPAMGDSDRKVCRACGAALEVVGG